MVAVIVTVNLFVLNLLFNIYGFFYSIIQASRETAQSATPTPDMETMNISDANSTVPADDAFAWEQTLIDNLLNFASTPKVSEITSKIHKDVGLHPK